MIATISPSISPGQDQHTTPAPWWSAVPDTLIPERRSLRVAFTCALLAVIIAITGYGWQQRRGPDRPVAPAIVAPTAQITPSQAPSSSWLTDRGNPARTGATDAPGPKMQPVELWNYSTGNSIHDQPLVSD